MFPLILLLLVYTSVLILIALVGFGFVDLFQVFIPIGNGSFSQEGYTINEIRDHGSGGSHLTFPPRSYRRLWAKV